MISAHCPHCGQDSTTCTQTGYVSPYLGVEVWCGDCGMAFFLGKREPESWWETFLGWLGF